MAFTRNSVSKAKTGPSRKSPNIVQLAKSLKSSLKSSKIVVDRSSNDRTIMILPRPSTRFSSRMQKKTDSITRLMDHSTILQNQIDALENTSEILITPPKTRSSVLKSIDNTPFVNFKPVKEPGKSTESVRHTKAESFNENSKLLVKKFFRSTTRQLTGFQNVSKSHANTRPNLDLAISSQSQDAPISPRTSSRLLQKSTSAQIELQPATKLPVSVPPPKSEIAENVQSRPITRQSIRESKRVTRLSLKSAVQFTSNRPSVQKPKSRKSSRKVQNLRPKTVRRSYLLRSRKSKPRNPTHRPPNVNRKPRVNVARIPRHHHHQLVDPIGPVPCRSASNHVNQMPAEMMALIFGDLDPVEQISLRRVCHLWKNVVESQISGRTQYVKLNLSTDTEGHHNCPVCPSFKPAHSIRAMQFEGIWDEPAHLRPDQSIVFTVPQPAFNVQMALNFGCLFPQLKTLVIYYDLKDSRSNIQNLIHLLSGCVNLESFSLIMSSDIKADRTLPWICETINRHFGVLKRLDLFVSDFDYHKLYDFHPRIEVTSNILQLTHMGMSCSPRNFYSIILNVGKENETLRQFCKKDFTELNSLSIQCRMNGPDVVRMFDTNPELTRVRRLQMTCVNNRQMLENFLYRFEHVENLQLYFCRPSWERFDRHWVTTLKTLKKLTELTLVDFLFSCEIPETRNYQFETVKKLTLGAHDLISHFRLHSPERVFCVKQFVSTIGYLFPNLEEIVVLAGERQVFQLPLKLIEEKMIEVLQKGLQPKIKKVRVELMNPTFLDMRAKRYTYYVLLHGNHNR